MDNSRAVVLASALAEKLDVHLKDLPLVASAAEPVTEKAVAIGTGAVALGITTHLGITPPVMGSDLVVDVLTNRAADLVGGKFLVEVNPRRAAEKIYDVITEKRAALGLST